MNFFLFFYKEMASQRLSINLSLDPQADNIFDISNLLKQKSLNSNQKNNNGKNGIQKASLIESEEEEEVAMATGEVPVRLFTHTQKNK